MQESHDTLFVGCPQKIVGLYSILTGFVLPMAKPHNRQMQTALTIVYDKALGLLAGHQFINDVIHCLWPRRPPPPVDGRPVSMIIFSTKFLTMTSHLLSHLMVNDEKKTISTIEIHFSGFHSSNAHLCVHRMLMSVIVSQ